MHWTKRLALAPFLAIACLPSAAAAQPSTVHVAFEVTGNWQTAFSGQISITNNAGWTIWDWSLQFDFAHSIDSIWDAHIVDHTGDHYTITAVQEPWEDGDIAPGETVAFSFIASPGGEVQTPTDGTLNGWPIVFNGAAPAPPPVTPVDPPAWPCRFFAPYVDATAWPPFDLVGTAQSEGVRFFTLGFIVGHGAGECLPSWGGYYPISTGYLLNEINAIRDLGGDVMVSFGGAANSELAIACEDVNDLIDAYQSVIDAYNLVYIDFDIEGAWVAHPASIQRRSQAIAALQANANNEGRLLRVWYTLPVLPTGLTADGLNVLQSALDHGVDIAGVNVMAMDYGEIVAPNGWELMGEYAIQAANSLFDQLQTLYANAGIPKTPHELWMMVGVTPMIGQNDVLSEVFWQEDANQVMDFLQQQTIGMLSFWSANRDEECPGGQTFEVSPHCSGIFQEPFEFTQIFLPFTQYLTGDLNGDGIVDVLDLLQLLAAWGPCTSCPEDINADGVVDVLDLLELLAAWGPCA